MLKYRRKLQLIMALSVGLFWSTVQAQDPYIPGQLIMKLIPSQVPDSVVAEIDGIAIDSIAGRDMFLVEFPATLPVEAAIEFLSNLPDVVFSQPNYQISLPEIQQTSIAFPDEDIPPFVAGASPGSLYGQPAAYSIGLDSAHIITRGEGSVVAVIDNGIELTHPYFEGSINSSGYDFVDQDDIPAEEQGAAYGHGTFVAGLIRLTAPQTSLLPIRAFDGDGIGTSFTVASAISLATVLDVDVINMSFVFREDNPSLQAACAEAIDFGIALVAAAGNQASSSLSYPAALPGVIAVSALDTIDLIADFSNYGTHIDVCAPGVNLYSSLAGEYEWGTWSGTSFAAPLVSATCALVRSINPDISPLDMEAHVRMSSDTEFAWGSISQPDIYYSYGRIAAFSSVVAFSYGDLDMSGEINITDLTALVGYCFLGKPLSNLGRRLTDFDCSTQFNIGDVVGLVEYIFGGGTDFMPCYAD
ncbi:MAG: S8 family serine peptidase [candidate division Zixibacteria bacterium]|nr:S8 family serine peptidase [candidate division Zixibacteria bacterium]